MVTQKEKREISKAVFISPLTLLVIEKGEAKKLKFNQLNWIWQRSAVA
jgi:DNA-binding Xre family transcriptional regulator